MRKISIGVLLFALTVGCAGHTHISLPPKVWWPTGGGDASQQPPEPDPTWPLNLPDRGY